MTSEEPEKHPARINSNKIFQKNTSQTVDFEIVFAGLLAASLVSVSDISPTLDFVSVVGAISLLLFTMIRRMAVDNPFALEKELMDKSLTIILATTFFGVLYIVALPAKIIHFRLGINYYPSFGMLLLFLIFATALLYESKFRDLFLWAGILLHNWHIKHHETPMGNILLNLSKFSLDKSFTSPNEMPDDVSEIYEIEEKETKTNQRRLTYIAIMFGVSTLIGLLFVIGNTVQLIVTGRLFEVGFVISLLIIALIALTGIVEFWFSRYLNASFNEIVGSETKMITYFVAFFTIIVSNPNVSVVNILRSIPRLI